MAKWTQQLGHSRYSRDFSGRSEYKRQQRRAERREDKRQLGLREVRPVDEMDLPRVRRRRYWGYND